MVNLDNILGTARRNITRILNKCPTISLTNDCYLSPQERKIIFDALKKLRDYHTGVWRLLKINKTGEDYTEISSVLEYVRSGISSLVASVEPYLHAAR